MLIAKKRTRRFTQKSKILEQNMVLLEMKMETTEIKSDKPWKIWTYLFLSKFEYFNVFASHL